MATFQKEVYHRHASTLLLWTLSIWELRIPLAVLVEATRHQAFFLIIFSSLQVFTGRCVWTAENKSVLNALWHRLAIFKKK